MHRTVFRALSAVLVALTAACGDDTTPLMPPSGPTDAGGIDDECSPESPCPLEEGMQGQALIAEVGDEDPWIFDVPVAGRIIDITLSTDAMFSPVQLEAALLGPSGEALSNRRWPSQSGPQRLRFLVGAPSAGVHRLIVRDVGRDGADRRNPYFVTLRLLEEPDANEPNGGVDVATPLAFGVPREGTIASQGDRDWYSVEVIGGRLLEIRMSVTGVGEVRHRWSLFAPDGTTRIAESVEPAGGAPWPVEVRAVGPAGGQYLLLVEDEPEDGEDADPGAGYVLEVRERTQPDRFEAPAGNDVPALATALAPGTPLSAFVASTADIDWYAVEVMDASEERPVILSAELAYPAPSPVQLQMTLLMPDATTPICEARDGDACRSMRFVRDGTGGPSRLSTAHLVTEPGRYLLSIRDLQDDAYDGDTSYTLNVTLTREPDGVGETYRGDGRATATVVPAATATTGPVIEFAWVEGYISYANDTDWYAFDIPGPVPDAPPGHNGDWLVRVELEMPGPTPVELNAFFFGPEDSRRESYRGFGPECRDGSPEDLDPCQYPDAENRLSLDFQTDLTPATPGQGDCFVVFREVTEAGLHYWRMSDLDRDDFDLGTNGRYRFRMSITAGCPAASACGGERFRDGGQTLCGRP